MVDVYVRFCVIYQTLMYHHINTITAEVKPDKEHAGATLEIPSEEILKKA